MAAYSCVLVVVCTIVILLVLSGRAAVRSSKVVLRSWQLHASVRSQYHVRTTAAGRLPPRLATVVPPLSPLGRITTTTTITSHRHRAPYYQLLLLCNLCGSSLYYLVACRRARGSA